MIIVITSSIHNRTCSGRGHRSAVEMLGGRLFRFIHTNKSVWQSSKKTLLAELRKKTGYTFSNCRKALELHENDVQKAEQWLMEQAQALGWSKATKLEGRATGQGLISVLVNDRYATMVEVNCETDFVARNKHFNGLVNTASTTALKYTLSSVPVQDLVNKTSLDKDALKSLVANDGKSLADHCALVIGSVGENLCVKRALCATVKEGVHIAGFSHPAPVFPGDDIVGKYGAIVAFKTPQKADELGKRLCQHVIGMNPAKIGKKGIDEPNPIPEDETTMIFQEYLLDPTITVEQLLDDNQAEVLDFARFEVGESLAAEQNLDSVETCG